MTPHKIACEIVSQLRSATFYGTKEGAEQQQVEIVERCVQRAITEDRERMAVAANQGQREALAYIDGWISHHLAVGLAAAAAGILDDMRVHIRAAIERIDRGTSMEATTHLGSVTVNP